MTRRILVVCTANVCRSPMAAGLLEDAIAAAGLDLAVTSAGTHHVDLPVDPQAVRAALAFGVDLSAHVPRQVTTEILRRDGADLVLTMTREQLRELVTLEPACFTRTFTLLEAVRRATDTPAPQSSTSWSQWLAGLAEGRTAAELLHPLASDDVPDPYGRPFVEVRRVARRLDAAVRALTVVMPTSPPPARG